MKFLVACATLILFPAIVYAQDYFSVSGTTFNKINETSLSKFFIHVYDIELWSKDGVYDPSHPHALHIVYAVDISKEDLVERSIEELQALGNTEEETLVEWQKKMLAVFRDVVEGDSIRAVAFPEKEIRFYYNGQPTGTIKDTDFVRAFMGIWLSEKTSEPEMRLRLISEL